EEIAGGAMVNYKDHSNLDIHNAEWFFTKPLPVVGSHDPNVSIMGSNNWQRLSKKPLCIVNV
ncbi:hypothetical protein, partial [Aeromonas caviae]|uniref:hypothetical protein n=1 Tax=Aeromonas caviae TaxID=648 RepID=UPI001CC6450E